MKILRVDLQKAKNSIKNEIKGYPRVERGNISRFHFVNSSETFQHLCCFQETHRDNSQTSSPEQHCAFREL